MPAPSRNVLLRNIYRRGYYLSGSRTRSTRAASTLILGIRREDPSRAWERRCPLSPDAVAELVAMGVNVQVQHCSRRIWTHDEFQKAGATIVRDVSEADIVVGIKEVPISELAPSPLKEQTHFMFSHTHKGQSYNMELLARLLRQGRLIDYELLTDRAGRDGKRTIAFGWHAGAAGLVEGLCAYSRYLLTLGIATPILHLPRPFVHSSLSDMRESLRTLGRRIHTEGLPLEAGPLVVAVTGAGQVSTGALDMLKEVFAVQVQPSELLKLVEEGGADLHKVYVVHVPAKHYLERKDGVAYERSDYYNAPQDYHSVLHKLISPYVSVIVNGAGWHPGFPRLMDNVQLAEAMHVAWRIGPGRLGTIADVTCDLEGGLEFVTKASTIDEPIFVAKPPGSPAEHPGANIVSIDILPTELPKDASIHFSNAFAPYLLAFIRQRLKLPIGQDEQPLLKALDRATIARDGKLLSPHEWLYSRLSMGLDAKSNVPNARRNRKNVLLLGSGMVAKPVVATLCKRSDLSLTIAGNDLKEAAALANGHDNAQAVLADASDKAQLEALMRNMDVVISLLPASMHPSIAKICVEQRVHLVTASYISPSMKALHSHALAAEVLLLNECGLDPGIDHCAAVELIRRVQDTGRQVKSFISFCGGLPAPEHSNVPLGYKFSWAPRGVLTAAKNTAIFKLEDELFEVPPNMLLESRFADVPLFQGFALEGLANRNSLDYLEPYGLGPLDGMKAQLRGTLRRYKGFATLMSILNRLGLLDESHTLMLDAWSSLTDRCLERRVGLPIKDALSRGAAMTDILGDRWYQAEASLEWLVELGLLPSGTALEHGFYPALPTTALAPLDYLSLLLSHRLRYSPGERDIVILGHEVVAESRIPIDSDLEASVHSSLLVVYGDEHSSAMARTVGLPVAFAALRVLDGSIDVRGVIGPTHPSIYVNMLKDLAEDDMVFKETVGSGPGLGRALQLGWTGP
ncbi:hypothetical protein CALVIDRAFT_488223 [Calocera viscosa TUFC12733]|uniref:Uncharacterized protein n=1 Tax=Calocera viscosa (strain TUFC12733) TaxID=1330018 RepID=A0A167HT73_CALVF|nr:hypothetical protein CALVIDRAFT_488223 [Calocera viscosa TUFC12733]